MMHVNNTELDHNITRSIHDPLSIIKSLIWLNYDWRYKSFKNASADGASEMCLLTISRNIFIVCSIGKAILIEAKTKSKLAKKNVINNRTPLY